jgi:hypothetical protein
MKLKLFKEAETELKQFENFEKQELFYETNPKDYSNRKGTMVAFGFRMLNAELPYYMGRADESINNLLAILKIVKGIIENLEMNSDSIRVWNERKNKVLYSLANILLSKKVKKNYFK